MEISNKDEVYSQIDGLITEHLLRNDFVLKALPKYLGDKDWIMVMLTTALAILRSDDLSKLPDIINILQELTEKIQKQTLRSKILECLISIKLKIALKTLSKLESSVYFRRIKKNENFETLLSFDEDFLKKLSKSELAGINQHVNDLKIWIYQNKSQLISLCHSVGAKEACITEFKEVIAETKKYLGKSFVEELASKFISATKTGRKPTTKSKAISSSNATRNSSFEKGQYPSFFSTQRRGGKRPLTVDAGDAAISARKKARTSASKNNSTNEDTKNKNDSKNVSTPSNNARGELAKERGRRPGTRSRAQTAEEASGADLWRGTSKQPDLFREIREMAKQLPVYGRIKQSTSPINKVKSPTRNDFSSSETPNEKSYFASGESSSCGGKQRNNLAASKPKSAKNIKMATKIECSSSETPTESLYFASGEPSSCDTKKGHDNFEPRVSTSNSIKTDIRKLDEDNTGPLQRSEHEESKKANNDIFSSKNPASMVQCKVEERNFENLSKQHDSQKRSISTWETDSSSSVDRNTCNKGLITAGDRSRLHNLNQVPCTKGACNLEDKYDHPLYKTETRDTRQAGASIYHDLGPSSSETVCSSPILFSSTPKHANHGSDKGLSMGVSSLKDDSPRKFAGALPFSAEHISDSKYSPSTSQGSDLSESILSGRKKMSSLLSRSQSSDRSGFVYRIDRGIKQLEKAIDRLRRGFSSSAEKTESNASSPEIELEENNLSQHSCQPENELKLQETSAPEHQSSAVDVFVDNNNIRDIIEISSDSSDERDSIWTNFSSDYSSAEEYPIDNTTSAEKPKRQRNFSNSPQCFLESSPGPSSFRLSVSSTSSCSLDIIDNDYRPCMQPIDISPIL